MRLEWIDDILAVLTAGSLSRAAEQRHLTQPAFSRRIRSIEKYVGVELLDRTRKPAELCRALVEQQGRLESLAFELRDLLHDLRWQNPKTNSRIVIASQHAITASIAPGIVKRLAADADTSVRLRSANRDECLALLLTRQAHLTLMYRVTAERLPPQSWLLEGCDFGREHLVPVYSSGAMATLDAQYRRREVPIIGYPSGVFLGQVVNREIFPKLRSRMVLRIRAETALTLAGLQLAEKGVGVAWVPLSLASTGIASGVLTDLSSLFGKAPLLISAIRFTGPKSQAEQGVWNVINELKEAERG